MLATLWTFSLRFYALPGVAPACLRCQDEAGADVNLMLYLLWKAHSGIRVVPAEIESLDAQVRDWREHVVQPLRSVRRYLKSISEPFEDAAKLRDAIKSAELEAERQEQKALSRQALMVARETMLPRDEAARANLAAYAAVIGRTLPNDAVAALLAAFASLSDDYRTNS